MVYFHKQFNLNQTPICGDAINNKCITYIEIWILLERGKWLLNQSSGG